MVFLLSKTTTVVISTGVPQVVSPSPTWFFRIFLEAAVSNQVLLTLPLSVAAELAPVGHGAMLLSLEERNTAAARMCQVLPLVKQGLAALIIVMTCVYVAMNESSLSIYRSGIRFPNISKYSCNIIASPNTLCCIIGMLDMLYW